MNSAYPLSENLALCAQTDSRTTPSAPECPSAAQVAVEKRAFLHVARYGQHVDYRRARNRTLCAQTDSRTTPSACESPRAGQEPVQKRAFLQSRALRPPRRPPPRANQTLVRPNGLRSHAQRMRISPCRPRAGAKACVLAKSRATATTSATAAREPDTRTPKRTSEPRPAHANLPVARPKSRCKSVRSSKSRATATTSATAAREPDTLRPNGLRSHAQRMRISPCRPRAGAKACVLARRALRPARRPPPHANQASCAQTDCRTTPSAPESPSAAQVAAEKRARFGPAMPIRLAGCSCAARARQLTQYSFSASSKHAVRAPRR